MVSRGDEGEAERVGEVDAQPDMRALAYDRKQKLWARVIAT